MLERWWWWTGGLVRQLCAHLETSASVCLMFPGQHNPFRGSPAWVCLLAVQRLAAKVLTNCHSCVLCQQPRERVLSLGCYSVLELLQNKTEPLAPPLLCFKSRTDKSLQPVPGQYGVILTQWLSLMCDLFGTSLPLWIQGAWLCFCTVQIASHVTLALILSRKCFVSTYQGKHHPNCRLDKIFCLGNRIKNCK